MASRRVFIFVGYYAAPRSGRSARQQEQNKAAQQRYRARKKQKAVQMESQVVNMQQQMAELQQVMRHNVSLQVPSPLPDPASVHQTYLEKCNLLEISRRSSLLKAARG